MKTLASTLCISLQIFESYDVWNKINNEVKQNTHWTDTKRNVSSYHDVLQVMFENLLNIVWVLLGKPIFVFIFILLNQLFFFRVYILQELFTYMPSIECQKESSKMYWLEVHRISKAWWDTEIRDRSILMDE